MSHRGSIYLAGHKGLVGSALLRLLRARNVRNVLTAARSELDLRETQSVNEFFHLHRPDVVILAAATVGGIRANQLAPADFLYDNLMIQNNVLHAAAHNGTKTFMFLGSSCMYPRAAPQPIKEECLLTGPLESTNEGYALAKIAGLKLAQYYQQQVGMRCICAIPCNLYGPNDRFDPIRSHVISALVRKFVEAMDANQSTVTLWGSGNARREFLHADDAAAALLLLLEKWESPNYVNVGSGIDLSIRDLSVEIATAVGYKGSIAWDPSMPDGMPRKCLDVSILNELGFQPQITLQQGILSLVDDFRNSRTAAPHQVETARPQ